MSFEDSLQHLPTTPIKESDIIPRHLNSRLTGVGIRVAEFILNPPGPQFILFRDVAESSWPNSLAMITDIGRRFVDVANEKNTSAELAIFLNRLNHEDKKFPYITWFQLLSSQHWQPRRK